MAKLQIDLSGRGGLAPKYFGDVNDVTANPQRIILAKDGQMAGGFYNSLKNYGYMSPATNSFKTITGAVSEVFSCSISDLTSQDAYFGEKSTQIWGLGDATDTSLSSLVTVTGATFTDLEIYQVNGVKKLFYAYKKAGGGNIGIATVPFASADVDWLSAAASGGFNTGASNDVIMTVADNGFMYVMDGAAVHKIDGTTNGGTNGTASANVLNFPATFTITDSIDYRGNMYIAVQTSALLGSASTSSEGAQTIGVYIWDRLTSVVRTRDFIPMPGAKEIRKLYISPQGDVRAIVINNDRFVEVRRFNGSAFIVMEQLDIAAYPLYRDSLSILGNMVTWLGADGVLYAHGAIFHGEKEGLYKLGDTSSVWSGTVTTGAILQYDASVSTSFARDGLILSFKDGSNKYTKRWHPNGTGTMDSVAQKSNQGDIYTPVRFLPTMSTVNYIDIFCAPGTTTGTNTQATIKIYFNQSTTAWASKTVTRNDITRGYVRFEIDKSYINTMQLEIEYPTGTTMSDAYDFRPSFASVDYTQTTTKG